MNIYLIGSLRNNDIPVIAEALRSAGHDVYDDWWAPGPETDDYWQKYEHIRGRTHAQALEGWHAKHVFSNDLQHLTTTDAAVLVLPAGKSGHLELGYVIGLGRPGHVYMPQEPDRFDIMYRFARSVSTSLPELVEALSKK